MRFRLIRRAQAEPGEAIAGLGQLMKRPSGRQTRFVNRQESHTGTLWESRYKSSPIQTDTYLGCSGDTRLFCGCSGDTAVPAVLGTQYLFLFPFPTRLLWH